MELYLYLIFILIAVFRVSVLYISNQHEKKLLEDGGKEYGKQVSKLLAILHTMFYFCALFEGIYKKVMINDISALGIIIVSLSFVVLIYVIRILGTYWTVKLIFVDDHNINSNWLFKYIKHPNYFLNIIPELIGVTFIFHAWLTLTIFSLPYATCLFLRIKEEDHLLNNIKIKDCNWF